MSKSATESVWMTRDPAIVALWDKWGQDSLRFTEEIKATLTDLGLNWEDAIVNYGNAWGGGDYLVGVKGECPGDDWRKQDYYWVPRRNSKNQKALSDRINAVKRPDYRADLPGMPKMAFSGAAVTAPGVEVHDGAMYVHWETNNVAGQVNSSIWTRIKLSEFHTAKEADQEKSTP